MNMKLEVIIVPVSDVDRAKEFYKKLGFREDADITKGDFRVVQFTPPGSSASIFIGSGVTAAAPGSMQGLVLVVDDIVAAHDELASKGIEVVPVFHGIEGLFYHATKKISEPGVDPERKSYNSFTALTDPDDNGWIVQEVTERLPGR